MSNLMILELVVYNLICRIVSFILTMIGIVLICLFISIKEKMEEKNV